MHTNDEIISIDITACYCNSHLYMDSRIGQDPHTMIWYCSEADGQDTQRHHHNYFTRWQTIVIPILVPVQEIFQFLVCVPTRQKTSNWQIIITNRIPFLTNFVTVVITMCTNVHPFNSSSHCTFSLTRTRSRSIYLLSFIVRVEVEVYYYEHATEVFSRALGFVYTFIFINLFGGFPLNHKFLSFYLHSVFIVTSSVVPSWTQSS